MSSQKTNYLDATKSSPPDFFCTLRDNGGPWEPWCHRSQVLDASCCFSLTAHVGHEVTFKTFNLDAGVRISPSAFFFRPFLRPFFSFGFFSSFFFFVGFIGLFFFFRLIFFFFLLFRQFFVEFSSIFSRFPVFFLLLFVFQAYPPKTTVVVAIPC